MDEGLFGDPGGGSSLRLVCTSGASWVSPFPCYATMTQQQEQQQQQQQQQQLNFKTYVGDIFWLVFWDFRRHVRQFFRRRFVACPAFTATMFGRSKSFALDMLVFLGFQR